MFTCKRLLLSCLAASLAVTLAAPAATKSKSKTRARTAAPRATARTAPPAPYKGVARDPYLGAIVVDAANGRVVFSDHADAPGYPASVIKLMNLLIVLEKIDQGAVKLTDPVTVTATAANIGGSQVYLKENETFTVEELLYAMMVQSANDAATALAIHVAGSPAAFVELMNKRAQELGMVGSHFNSVHGLPPSNGASHDITTAHDLSLLARAVLKHPVALTYTATRERPFRNGTFIMRTHNHLLGAVPGCDGLKTGFFTAAGYSIVATAQRHGVRVIAVVLGSRSRLKRDAEATALLNKGFAALPPPPPPPAATNLPAIPLPPPPPMPPATLVSHPPYATLIALGAGIIALLLILIMLVAGKRRPRK